MAPVFTVPALPTTIAGFRPAFRSSAIARFSRSTRTRKRSSVGIFRSCFQPMPSRSTALSTQLWTSSDTYTTSGGVPAKPSSRTVGALARRAVARAVKFAIEPPEVSRPSVTSGRPRISASQATTRRSTWMAAWSPPQQLLFIAEAR